MPPLPVARVRRRSHTSVELPLAVRLTWRDQQPANSVGDHLARTVLGACDDRFPFRHRPKDNDPQRLRRRARMNEHVQPVERAVPDIDVTGE